MTIHTTLSEALIAAAPHPFLADELKLYGFLVGAWTYHAKVQTEPGMFVEADGDMQCAWVLGGRALQEVWNLPGFFYGSILRVYDPDIDAWHIFWHEPVDQYYTQLIGHAEGDDIVQVGKNKQGQEVRWSFREITPDSFRWIGEIKNPDGSWYLHRDMRAKRAA